VRIRDHSLACREQLGFAVNDARNRCDHGPYHRTGYPIRR
jgi:hypothetical protein